jgi:hypothetical protein
MVGMASNGMDLIISKHQSSSSFYEYDPTDVLKIHNYWLRPITRYIRKKMKIS